MSACDLHRVTLTLCTACLEGRGGECHSPGCAFWMNRAPDIPIEPLHDVAAWEPLFESDDELDAFLRSIGREPSLERAKRSIS